MIDTKEKVEKIRLRVLDTCDFAMLSDEQLEEAISRCIETEFCDTYMSLTEMADIGDQVFSLIRGLGLLDSIIHDDAVTEVMINGYQNIFIEKGGKVSRLDEEFEDEKKLEDVIQKIVGMAGREVNEANPIVDTRLADGSRVNVVLPPISLKGPIVTIRKFSKEPMTIEKLIDYGSITKEIAEVLEILVRAKYNIFICGGTGSGKTTFLNAISNYIPGDERVITIEDSAEVRGAEALDMLQAMNTGHDGSLSTGHANSANDMLSRLETMVLTGAEGLPLEAVRQQIASAVDIIIHLSRLRDRSRKTMEITEVAGYENGRILLNPLYRFEEDENTTVEKVSGSLNRTKNKLIHTTKLQIAGYKLEI